MSEPLTMTAEREMEWRKLYCAPLGVQRRHWPGDEITRELDAEREAHKRTREQLRQSQEVSKALLEAAIDLIDASQDARCADLRIVVKRARAVIALAERLDAMAPSGVDDDVNGTVSGGHHNGSD